MKRFIFLLTAIFICTIAYAHTINWYVGNTILETTTCDSGESITPPTAPYKYGYHFVKWKLPYTPIEYLESTGTQYIDTGYIPNQDTGIKTTIFITNIENLQARFFGASKTPTIESFEAYIYNRKIGFHYGDELYGPFNINLHDIILLDWNKNIIKYSINGLQAPTINFVYKTFLAPNNMVLFGINRSQNIGAGYIRVFYLQIYDNDILVRDFIPVLDPDGVPCMFDKVEKKFYYNAGTGQFIAGPVITE